MMLTSVFACVRVDVGGSCWLSVIDDKKTGLCVVHSPPIVQLDGSMCERAPLPRNVCVIGTVVSWACVVVP